MRRRRPRTPASLAPLTKAPEAPAVTANRVATMMLATPAPVEEPPRPITRRLWFWVAVTGAVVAGVLIGIAVQQPEPHAARLPAGLRVPAMKRKQTGAVRFRMPRPAARARRLHEGGLAGPARPPRVGSAGRAGRAHPPVGARAGRRDRRRHAGCGRLPRRLLRSGRRQRGQRHRRGARRGRLRAGQRERDRPGAEGRRDQRADDAVRPAAASERLRPRRRRRARDGGDDAAR